MKVVACCFTLAAALPSWEEYKRQQGLSFNGKEEELRQSIFNGHVDHITEENLKGNSLQMDVTKYTHLTNDEFRAVIKGTKAVRFSGEATSHTLSGAAPQVEKDWRSDGVVTPVKDQGGCGSCWAFSAVETLESRLAIATGSAVQELSPQQIVSCSPNPQHCGGSGGCAGSTQPLAFNYTVTAGITTEADYPYQGSTGTCSPSKISPVAYNDGYTNLKLNDYTELMDAILQGPVSISIAAGGSAFQLYGGGVLSNCNDFVMDHAVQLVGYGTDSNSSKDYWLVRNSWGPGWGEGGYIRMQRYGDGNEPCGTDSTPQDGDACDGDTTPREYCGECGILSSSSYPTGMRAVTPPPSPTPSPTPTPSPSPSPTPGCADIEDDYYCSYVVSNSWCPLIGSDCVKSCNCCDDPSACGADSKLRALAHASLSGVQV